MWNIIFLFLLLILITIVIHLVITRFIFYLTKKHINSPSYHLHLPKSINLAATVIMLFFASIIEALIWGVCYHWGGAIDGFSEALYFSIVTFTTLGYGDITLTDPWRLLGSFQAAIGIIIFGWSTAIVTAAVQRLYFHK